MRSSVQDGLPWRLSTRIWLLLLWRQLHAQAAVSDGVRMPTITVVVKRAMLRRKNVAPGPLIHIRHAEAAHGSSMIANEVQFKRNVASLHLPH